MKLLKEITKLMEEETLLSVEYTSKDITIKVTKAGFKDPVVPELDSEAKGIDDVDESDLFWSADK